MAEIAFVRVTIVSTVRLPALVPLERLVDDDAVHVSLAQDPVDCLSVELLGARAGSAFEVVRYAAGGDEVVSAEGALDRCASVNSRIAVLRKIKLCFING